MKQLKGGLTKMSNIKYVVYLNRSGELEQVAAFNTRAAAVRYADLFYNDTTIVRKDLSDVESSE